jgi:hypothetical protein
MKKDRLASTLTSIFFFAPSYIAFSSGKLRLSGLFLVLVIVSTLYHYHKPRGFEWWWQEHRSPVQNTLLFLDIFFGGVTFVAVIAHMFSGRVSPLQIIGLALFVLGFIMTHYVKRYFEFIHSLWHFIAALASVLILMG